MMKLKRIIILILLIAAVCALCLVMTGTAGAETAPEPQTSEEITDETQIEQTGLGAATTKFIDYLKERYGADYEFYYNQIIDGWGSIEEYLLSFGEKLPEEYKTGWDEFVGGLTKYSAVWAPALAVGMLILIAVIGRKMFKSVVERTVNAKLAPIVKELNAQSAATVSVMRAQRKLLGTSEKFASTVEELEKSERGLTGEQV